MVEMKPEYAEALKSSSSYSSKPHSSSLNPLADKGRSAFLLKPSSKHKRRRNEMEEVKDEEELLKRDK